MANKQTIQDVDAQLDVLHKRLTRTVNEITDLRAKRKRMITGKIKVPPPPGVKVSFATSTPAFDDALPEELKLRPVAPGSSGPC